MRYNNRLDATLIKKLAIQRTVKCYVRVQMDSRFHIQAYRVRFNIQYQIDNFMRAESWVLDAVLPDKTQTFKAG
jgi:hypothetical protein